MARFTVDTGQHVSLNNGNKITIGYTPWTPHMISTSAWYDASDFNTITQSGGLVSQWNDKSGNGKHVVQATGANQPTTGTRKIGGLNVIDFDGATDHFKTSGTLNNDCNAAIVVCSRDSVINSAASAQTIIATKLNYQAGGEGGFLCGLPTGACTGAFANEVLAVFDEDQADTYVDRQGISSANLSSIAANTPFMYVANRGASGWFLGVNGSGDLRNLTSGTRHAMHFSEGLMIGGQQGNSLLNMWDGNIAEVIIAQSEWSTSDRQKLEGYLAWKWGLVANLPINHLYKNRAP